MKHFQLKRTLRKITIPESRRHQNFLYNRSVFLFVAPWLPSLCARMGCSLWYVLAHIWNDGYWRTICPTALLGNWRGSDGTERDNDLRTMRYRGHNHSIRVRPKPSCWPLLISHYLHHPLGRSSQRLYSFPPQVTLVVSPKNRSGAAPIVLHCSLFRLIKHISWSSSLVDWYPSMLVNGNQKWS